MWDALMVSAQAAPALCESDRRYTPGSMMSRIRAYLRVQPHRTAYQVAAGTGITQTQAHVALHDMAKRRDVCWSLDASTLRNRQTKHYSLL
jgi:hypothetical protein